LTNKKKHSFPTRRSSDLSKTNHNKNVMITKTKSLNLMSHFKQFLVGKVSKPGKPIGGWTKKCAIAVTSCILFLGVAGARQAAAEIGRAHVSTPVTIRSRM